MKPNVWGQGVLFAFSGWDGPTDWADDFVLVPDEEPFGWSLAPETPVRFRLVSGSRKTLPIREAEVIANDHLAVTLDAGNGAVLEVRMAMHDRESVVGTVTARGDAAEAGLELERPGWSGETDLEMGKVVLKNGNAALAVTFRAEKTRCEANGTLKCSARLEDGQSAVFALSRNTTWEPTAQDAAEAFAKRAQFFDKIPAPPAGFVSDNEPRARTYAKCAAVMKVNLHTPQGAIPFNWSTPDRMPHRHMWLWDSAFHAVGLRHLDPALAGDQIKSMLAHVQEDGYLPHCVEPNGNLSKITQPPVLGWAAMKVYRTRPDREFLEYVYPRLRKFLEFFPEQRDRDGNGLCEWEDGDASGMDNSPRFDSGPEFDAIDLNCFLVREYEVMAEMAEALGGETAGDADLWRKRAKKKSERINEHLWDDETGFYLDRKIGGDLVPLKTSCGFLPLFAGVATKERAARLLEHLKSEKEFWTPLPVPSVARGEEPYCKDMWRGPTWANYNYLIIEGLERYGYEGPAKEITERTVDEIARWYLEDGVIFEIYDAEAEISPRRMPRKGKYGGSDWKNTVVRDYHWTAAVYVALALEKF